MSARALNKMSAARLHSLLSCLPVCVLRCVVNAGHCLRYAAESYTHTVNSSAHTAGKVTVQYAAHWNKAEIHQCR